MLKNPVQEQVEASRAIPESISVQVENWRSSIKLSTEGLENTSITLVTDASRWARGYLLTRYESADVYVVGQVDYGHERRRLLVINGSHNIHLRDPEDFQDWGDSGYVKYFEDPMLPTFKGEIPELLAT